MLRVIVKRTMAPTVKMERVALTGKGGWNLTCYMYKCMKLIVKYFFLADVVFLRGSLRFGSIHFPLADVFYVGGHFRLESSCIWVNTVQA